MIFQPGTKFGKYRLLGLLGQGGMADVYEAEEISVRRLVALKVLPAAFARDQERASRFAKEIQASAKLDHPSIVSVFDVGEVDGLHYYTMSVLPGGDLKGRLKGAELSADDALQIASEIASALAYAHNNGFVHRDVKPENILFREDGSAVLTDFGIARATVGGTRMTATGLSIGTPHYMSPEQARGQEVDGRSDLYALGVVFYEMLTGQVPFDAQDSFAVGLMHINDPAPQLPKSLARYQPIVDKLLAKDPGNRYASGRELVTDLDRIKRGQRIPAATNNTRLVRRSKADSRIGPSSSSARSSEEKSGHALRWGLGGAALATVVAMGIYLWQYQQVSPQRVGGGSENITGLAQPEVAITEPEVREPAVDQIGSSILHIDTEPAGAEVFLNDKRLGETPFQSETLPSGEHSLRLAHPRHEPWERSIELENDVVSRITASLIPSRGQVTVVTDPPGAEVWIDGEQHPGTTPLTITDLEAGKQALEIRLAAYQTENRTVTVSPDDPTKLELELQGGDLYQYEGRWIESGELVSELLQSAETDLVNNRISRPEGRNALAKYQRVLSIDSDNSRATEGINEIVQRYQNQIESSIEAGDLNRSEELINILEGISQREGLEVAAGTVLEHYHNLHELGRTLNQALARNDFSRVRQSLETARQGGVGKQFLRHYEDQLLREQVLAPTNIYQLTEAELKERQLLTAEVVGKDVSFRDCESCPEMVVIPAGLFASSAFNSNSYLDENRRNSDSLMAVEAFAISKYKIPRSVYKVYVSTTKEAGEIERSLSDECFGIDEQLKAYESESFSWRTPGPGVIGDVPTVCVSWGDAAQYSVWLSDQSGFSYELVTDTQWSYLAELNYGLYQHSFNWETDVCEYGNLSDQALKDDFPSRNANTSCSDGYSYLSPVSTYEELPFGVVELVGNTAEWTADCWTEAPKSPPVSERMILVGNCDKASVRGSDFLAVGGAGSLAHRRALPRYAKIATLGFRVARRLASE